MGGEKRWPLVEGPPISVGRLVLMLTTVGEQLMFFMKKKRFLSGIARIRGGVYPCSNFLALFQKVHFVQ